jgi:hypothetical protein
MWRRHGGKQTVLPSTSDFGGEELQVEDQETGVERQLRLETEEKDERDKFTADRQLREEWIERDTGPEDWMRLGKDTVRRISEISTKGNGVEG